LDQAIKTYQTALGINPELTMLHFRLGVVYYSINSPKKAKEELELYLKDSPEGKDARKAREILSNLQP
jgi:tetratricopeptide (TPR) repeat protein